MIGRPWDSKSVFESKSPNNDDAQAEGERDQAPYAERRDVASIEGRHRAGYEHERSVADCFARSPAFIRELGQGRVERQRDRRSGRRRWGERKGEHPDLIDRKSVV